jgi:hypothetical protein
MRRIRPHALGLIIAAQFAGWHAGWSFLVGIGWAQRLFDFVLQLYMVAPGVRIAGFSFLAATQLTVLATCFGYSLGLSLAAIWNLLVADESSPGPENAEAGAILSRSRV